MCDYINNVNDTMLHLMREAEKFFFNYLKSIFHFHIARRSIKNVCGAVIEKGFFLLECFFTAFYANILGELLKK